MKIYIALDPEGYPESVVFAKSKELANAYWHGKGVYPYSTEEIGPIDLKDHPTGVISIASSRKVQKYDLDHLKGDRELLLMNKRVE